MASISIGFAMVPITGTRYAITLRVTIIAGCRVEKNSPNASFPVVQETRADLLNGSSDSVGGPLNLDDSLS
jgi:hypothetical protein